MSRSQKNQSTKKAQTLHDTPYTDIPENQRQYIGRDKPKLDISVQQPDRYSYDRWKASRKLGLPEWELADEPDGIQYDLKEREDYGR